MFSEDVLKIEICGPDEDYLTVIDVPGIFNSKDEFTTEEDKKLVLNMVRNYIKDERTIILAVLPSNVDVQTQGILDLAEDYDKGGERTLGVLTKVDLLGTEQSSKIPVCNLILGKKKPLTLGYYLVRNRGGDEDETIDVAQKEDELFQEEPWNKLPRDRLGIVPLRARLTELLGQITDKAFPKIRTQIRQMLVDSQQELESLGASRQTEREQQLYLITLAGHFQDLVRAALDADYSRHAAFGDGDSLRLITFIVNLSEQFSEDFEHRAHARHFESIEVPTESEVLTEGIDGSEPVVSPDQSVCEAVYPSDEPSHEDSACQVLEYPDLNSYPELRGIIATNWETSNPKDGIMRWIKDLYYKSRGVELGTFGARMLSSAFREQSQNWRIIAQQYVSRVVLFIHRFVTRALEVVCPDRRARSQIFSVISDELLSRYKAGMEQAMFLVSVEREKRPYTLNHYFNENLQICRGTRVSNALRAKAREETAKSYSSGKLVVDFNEIKSAATDESNAEHMQKDIHDILKSYYKVARKRFVDNVYHQAVDHFLLSGPMSPLAVFCEKWAVMLDKEKLEAVAGESRLTRDKRDSLRRKIEDLNDAIEIITS